jgi:hypothetical protein
VNRAFGGQQSGDGEPAAGPGTDVQGAAKGRGAFTHPGQPVAAIEVTGRPSAVVVDADAQRVVAVADPDGDASGTGVFAGIGECLLNDPVGGQIDSGGQFSGGAFTSTSTGRPAARVWVTSSSSRARPATG